MTFRVPYALVAAIGYLQAATPVPPPNPPSLTFMWTWSVLAAAIGYLLCRRRPWLALFVVPLSLLVPAATLVECAAGGNGAVAGIGAEPCHNSQAWLAIGLILVAEFVGLVQGGFKFHFFLAELFAPRGGPEPPSRNS